MNINLAVGIVDSIFVSIYKAVKLKFPVFDKGKKTDF